MKKLLLIFLIPMFAMAQGDLNPSGFVNDFAGLLSTEQKNNLENKISSFEKKTDIEISICLVSTLNGKEILEFSNELFRKWGIGKSDRNNGLLLVVAPNERKWRIEVGYGLEPYITDFYAKEIGEEFFPGNFKVNNYYNGLLLFTNEITKNLGNSTWEDRISYTKKQEEIRRVNEAETISIMINIFLGLLGLAILTLLFLFYNKIRKERVKFKKDKSDSILYYNDLVHNLTNLLVKYGRNVLSLPNANPSISNLLQHLKKCNDNNFDDIKTKLDFQFNFYKQLIETFEAIDYQIEIYNEKIIHVNELKSYFNDPVERDLNLKYDPNSDISELKSDLRLIISYNNNLDNINKDYTNLKMYSNEILNINDIITNYNLRRKYDSYFYKPELTFIDTHIEKIKTLVTEFNDTEKIINNVDKLDKIYEDININVNNIINHYNEVSGRNDQRNSMINVLDNSKSLLNEYTKKLNTFKKDSDVDSDNIRKVNSLLKSITMFTITTDIISSYNDYIKITNDYKSIIKNCEYDISRANRAREEMERTRRASYSSYTSYSSSSSSSSSSDSFSGFGGGDSGGGGASGSW